MKKQALRLALAAVAILGVALLTACDKQDKQDKQLKISDVPGYSDFFDAPIEKIKLREYATSPDWAVFEDADLVAQWQSFLQKLTLKPLEGDPQPQVVEPLQSAEPSADCGEGGGYATVTVNGKEYYFWFSLKENKTKTDRIELGEKYYTVDLSDCPFQKTFDEAIERHGVTTPWDSQ